MVANQMRNSFKDKEIFMTADDMLLLNPKDPPGSLFSVGGLYHKVKNDYREKEMKSFDRDSIDSAKIRKQLRAAKKKHDAGQAYAMRPNTVHSG